jgi:hypothetical protein
MYYLYAVVPGGKQASSLQTSNRTTASVEFVNGPGVQLVVTDDAGQSANSPVAMLNYQQ